MSLNSPVKRILPLIFYAMLLGCGLAGVFLATEIFLPAAQVIMAPYGAPFPEFSKFAFRIDRACFESVGPIAMCGSLLFIVAIVGRGPARLVLICRVVLAVMAGTVSIASTYLLVSGGIATKVAADAQLTKFRFYEQALDHFGILEATQERYAKLRTDFNKYLGAQLVEAHSVSEFSNDEARVRISAVIDLLSTTTDPTVRKQLLATLALFRDRIQPYQGQKLLHFAVDAGVPSTESYAAALSWITANLNKDGWDPVLLFKISQREERISPRIDPD